MNYCSGILVKSRQTESGAYEPTVQYAQVGSKIATIGQNGPKMDHRNPTEPYERNHWFQLNTKK